MANLLQSVKQKKILSTNVPVCQTDSRPGRIHRQTAGSILFAGLRSFRTHWIHNLEEMVSKSVSRKNSYIQDSEWYRRARECSRERLSPHWARQPRSGRSGRLRRRRKVLWSQQLSIIVVTYIWLKRTRHTRQPRSGRSGEVKEKENVLGTEQIVEY